MALSGTAVGSVIQEMDKRKYNDAEIRAVFVALNDIVVEDGGDGNLAEFEDELASLLLRTKGLKGETLVEAMHFVHNCR
jgi:hypothetical protein